MPLVYKLPAYGGNAFLVLIGCLMLANDSPWSGIFILLIASLNLFLIRKLDLMSREEAWLALELRKAKMREELLAVEARLRAGGTQPLDRTLPPPA